MDVRKNQSHKEGVRNRGPSIWLIFTYIVQFFTLILVVLSVFRKSITVAGYGSLKFWQTRPREKIHNFLICGPNRMRFSALNSSWKTLQIMQLRSPATINNFSPKNSFPKKWPWPTAVFRDFDPIDVMWTRLEIGLFCRELNSASEYVKIFKKKGSRNHEKCVRTRKTSAFFAKSQFWIP